MVMQDREVLIARSLVDPRQGIIPIIILNVDSDSEPKLVPQLEAVEILSNQSSHWEASDGPVKSDKSGGLGK